MHYIQQQYHEIRQFYKQYIKRTFIVLLIAFIIAAIAFSFILSTNPGLATRLLLKSGPLIERTINLAGILPAIVKNLFTGFYLIGLGVIPFLFIPALFVLLNGSVIGVLIGSTSISSITIGLILTSMLPHGIVLIPSMLLASAYGCFLCKVVMQYVLHKHKILPFKTILIEFIRFYVFVLIPLMTLAALLQSLLTPLLIALF